MPRVFVVSVALLLVTSVVQADVTGHALVATCAKALANAYTGVEAAQCDWYVNPCGVCGREAPAKAWCVPDGLSSADLARVILAAFKGAPMALKHPVKPFVEAILTARFPCAALR